MIRRPPRSTLFPTRRSSDLESDRRVIPNREGVSREGGPRDVARRAREHHRGAERSEEHTSELQSRLHLVCRLLLEKKKKQIRNKDQQNKGEATNQDT